MTYALIDDRMWAHRKVLEAGNAAFGAWVRMLCWVRQHRTDGCVPHAVALLCASADELAALIRIRLLDQDASGELRIHDFLDHNKSAAELAADADEKAKRRSDSAKKAANARWNKGAQDPGQDASSPAPHADNDASTHAFAMRTHSERIPDRNASVSAPSPDPSPKEEREANRIDTHARVAAVRAELARHRATSSLASGNFAEALVGVLELRYRADVVARAIHEAATDATDAGLTDEVLRRKVRGYCQQACNRAQNGSGAAHHTAAARAPAREVRPPPPPKLNVSPDAIAAFDAGVAQAAERASRPRPPPSADEELVP